MARLARSQQIAPDVIVHSTYKGHNKEKIFRLEKHKAAYLADIEKAAGETNFNLLSFSLLNNHEHVASRPASVTDYSTFFHDVHGAHAQRYNKDMDRSGSVGNGRPHSQVVQDDRHFMNMMFYIDANAVRAGIVKHARDYRWSSYNFYAYGKQGPGTKALVRPDWYMRLGRTDELRQQAYRRLFDAYLRKEGMIPQPGMSSGYYVGDAAWIKERREARRLAETSSQTILAQAGRDTVDTS